MKSGILHTIAADRSAARNVPGNAGIAAGQGHRAKSLGDPRWSRDHDSPK